MVDGLLLFLAAAFVLALAGWAWLRHEGGWMDTRMPPLRTASELLVKLASGSSRRPDGHTLEKLVQPRDGRDWDMPVAPPAEFAAAMNLLLSTGDVVESGGRYRPSPAAQALVDGLYPKVGLGMELEEAVAAYLRDRPRGRAVERFAADDAEVRAAFAAHAAQTGPL